jgi:hypothetical protein
MLACLKTEAGLAYDDGMPTVMRMQGFRFVIWPDDHVPPHVHVRKGGNEVVINLIDGRIRDRRGMSDQDVAKARRLVHEFGDDLMAAWRHWHG